MVSEIALNQGGYLIRTNKTIGYFKFFFYLTSYSKLYENYRLNPSFVERKLLIKTIHHYGFRGKSVRSGKNSVF